MRVRFSGFVEGKLEFAELYDAPPESFDLAAIAEAHAERLKDKRHMIEIEFLDEVNPLTRFFRIGTDTRGMVMPLEVEL